MNTVSVVIPCFNAGIHLKPCIASVTAQRGSFKLLEILVVDDGSTDDATRLALEEISSIEGVRILHNSRQKGAAGARNTGISRASAAWIALLDADDWWPEDSLSRRFDALSEYPDAVWVGGDFCDVQNGTEPSNVGRFSQRLTNYPFLASAYEPKRRPLLLASPLDQFLVGAPTWTCVTMLRRDVLQTHGGFAENLLRAQDFHLWVRLAASLPFLFVPHVLAYYRHHDSNSTKSASHTLKWRSAALRDLLHLSQLTPVKKNLSDQLASTTLSLSYEYRKERRFYKATLSAISALAQKPFAAPAWKNMVGSVLRMS